MARPPLAPPIAQERAGVRPLVNQRERQVLVGGVEVEPLPVPELPQAGGGRQLAGDRHELVGRPPELEDGQVLERLEGAHRVAVRGLELDRATRTAEQLGDEGLDDLLPQTRGVARRHRVDGSAQLVGTEPLPGEPRPRDRGRPAVGMADRQAEHPVPAHRVAGEVLALGVEPHPAGGVVERQQRRALARVGVERRARASGVMSARPGNPVPPPSPMSRRNPGRVL